MIYVEFKEASKKHLLSCQFILDNFDKANKCEEHLLSTVYYLTGYVLETIFKYAIYAAINYDKRKDIKSLSSNGLTYLHNIQVHKLEKLKRIIDEKNITSLQKYDHNKKLFNGWDSEVRYKKNVTYSETEIISFFEFSKDIFLTLQRYR